MPEGVYGAGGGIHLQGEAIQGRIMRGKGFRPQHSSFGFGTSPYSCNKGENRTQFLYFGGTFIEQG